MHAYQPTDRCWCTYEAYDNFSIIIQIIYSILLLPSTIYIMKLDYIILRAWRNAEGFSQQYYIAFGLLTSWAICSFIKGWLNVAVYYQYMLVKGTVPENGIVSASGVFEMFDSIAAYSLILELIVIPYNWLKSFFSQMGNIDNAEHLNIPLFIRKKLNGVFCILKIIQMYLVWRILTIFYFFMQPFLIGGNSQFGCKMSRINAFYLIGEALLFILFYVMGYLTAFYLRRQNIITITPNQLRDIKFQYFLLFSALISRITFHLINRLFLTLNDGSSINCLDIRLFHKIVRSLMLFIDHAIMHLMPVIVIIYVYRPDRYEKYKNSLIHTASRSGSFEIQ